MDIETVRSYCLSKPLATEDSAFGPEGVLFRVYNKIFAYVDLERPELVVLKCNPDYALQLRDQYAGIQEAWHWNKKHWNEVFFNIDVPDNVVLSLIDHSLSEVLKKLSKRLQNEYATLTSSHSLAPHSPFTDNHNDERTAKGCVPKQSLPI